MRLYRLYFNCRQDVPNIWSWDEGSGTEEHIVQDIQLFDCTGVFKFDPSKHLPEASAWLEVYGWLKSENGKVTIIGNLNI